MSFFGGGKPLAQGQASFTSINNAQPQQQFGFPSGPRSQGTPSRGLGRGTSTRGSSRGRGNSEAQGWAPAGRTPKAVASSGDPAQRFQALRVRRDLERRNAIRNGFLADPDKPRTLKEAITPVGTCPDMCAEYERLERIVQKDVWQNETRQDGTPDEARMVKKFRRAAAGIDEQLPSDLRPPATLSKTCDYLFDTLIGSEDLAAVHHFVWDRSRAIRNDFSIQQITKSSDVEVAIDCYERIARFHILSLHQFALAEKPYDKYDWYQEREQLDRTLLSLMQYYDDNRTTLLSRNEAEFRAYCIIFQIQDPIPDLEDRVASWPPAVRLHPRVRIALDLYASACNITDPQGPLKPRAASLVAREDWNAFFTRVESDQVSYLMACVAEIYFNVVRRQILNNIWRASRRSGGDVTDFALDILTDLLRFDDPDQTRDFCEHYGFGFKDLADGSDEYLDLSAVQGKTFPEPVKNVSAQIFSQSVVERKRFGRAFPAVIRGYNIATARADGLVNDEELSGAGSEMTMTDDDSDSLFVATDSPVEDEPAKAFSPFAAASEGSITPKVNPFQSNNSFVSPFTATSSQTQAASNPFSAKANTTTASSTPPGSPFAPASTGLQKSAFAFNPMGPSSAANKSNGPTSGFGKPSVPITGSAQTSSQSSGFTFGLPTTQPKTNDPIEKSDKPFMTSIHAAPSFSWSKPSTSSPAWSTPSAAPQTSPAVDFQASSSESKSSNTSQAPLPTFTFGQPTAAKSAGAGLGASIFAQNPGLPSQTFPPSEIKAAPEQKTAKPASFTFGAPNASSDVPKAASSAPNFNLGAVQVASTTKDDAPKAQQPMFNFANATNGPAVGAKDFASAAPTFSFSNPDAGKTQMAHTPSFSFSDTTQSKPQANAASLSSPAPVSQSNSTRTSPGSSSSPPSATSPAPLKDTALNTSQPNQPKKRSPLSQSFSAEEELAGAPPPAPDFDTPPKIFASPAPAGKALPAFKVPNTSAAPSESGAKTDAAAILERLATEIVTDTDRGLLRQFVEYHARPVILSIYEELYFAEMRAVADNHRREKLAKKYGRKWRENSWKIHLARQGKERREKRRTARRPREANTSSFRQSVSTTAVDDFLMRQSVRAQESRQAAAVPRTEQSASRRSSEMSAASEVTDTASLQEKVRNIKVTGYVDAAGRVSKPATPAKAAEASHRRSHFLGYTPSAGRSIYGSVTPRQSLKSPYFRMKALGLHPITSEPLGSMGPPPAPASKKRAREVDDTDSASSPPHKKTGSSPELVQGSHFSRVRSNSLLSRSSSRSFSPAASTIASHAMSRAEQDEDLLARARAARQSLRNPSRPQAQAEYDAMSTISLQDTPAASTERARMQARLRAVQRAEHNLGQSLRDPDVPAYRLRESRFVPREQYGRAIERAQEMISARVRSASRSSDQAVLAAAPAESDVGLEEEPEQAPSLTNRPSSRQSSVTSTQPDESLQFQTGQNLEHIPLYQPVFHASQPPHTQMQEETYMPAGAPTDDMEVDSQDPRTFASFQPPPETQPQQQAMTSFGQHIDTNSVALSSYLDIGYDASAPTLDAPGHLPNIEATWETFDLAESVPITYPDLVTDVNHTLHEAARQALGFDSSMIGPETHQLSSTPNEHDVGFVHERSSAATPLYQESPADPPEPDRGRSPTPHIDPSLFEPAPGDILVAAVQRPQTPGAASNIVQDGSSEGAVLVSNNPFAVLANGSASEPSPSEESDVQDSASENDEGATSAISFKQMDDEHFVTNGIIQDHGLQVAQQPELGITTSFSSADAPSFQEASAFAAINSHAPKEAQTPTRRYHTRSRSRELSAQPSISSHMQSSPATRTFTAAVNKGGDAAHRLHLDPVLEDGEESIEDDATEQDDAPLAAAIHEEQSSDEHGVGNGGNSDAAAEDMEGASSTRSDDSASQSGSDQAGQITNGQLYAYDDADGPDERRYCEAGHARDDEDEDEEEAMEDEDGSELGYGEDGSGLGYGEDGEEYDDEDEEEEEGEFEDDGAMLSPGRMQEAGLIKGGTGQTAEDAFELSD